MNFEETRLRPNRISFDRMRFRSRGMRVSRRTMLARRETIGNRSRRHGDGADRSEFRSRRDELRGERRALRGERVDGAARKVIQSAARKLIHPAFRSYAFRAAFGKGAPARAVVVLASLGGVGVAFLCCVRERGAPPPIAGAPAPPVVAEMQEASPGGPPDASPEASPQASPSASWPGLVPSKPMRYADVVALANRPLPHFRVERCPCAACEATVRRAWRRVRRSDLERRLSFAKDMRSDAAAPELDDLTSGAPDAAPELVCCGPEERTVMFRMPQGECTGVAVLPDGGTYSIDKDLTCDVWHQDPECALVVVERSPGSFTRTEDPRRPR